LALKQHNKKNKGRFWKDWKQKTEIFNPEALRIEIKGLKILNKSVFCFIWNQPETVWRISKT